MNNSKTASHHRLLISQTYRKYFLRFFLLKFHFPKKKVIIKKVFDLLFSFAFISHRKVFAHYYFGECELRKEICLVGNINNKKYFLDFCFVFYQKNIHTTLLRAKIACCARVHTRTLYNPRIFLVNVWQGTKKSTPSVCSD